MFKLNQAATFSWPVEFNLPTDGGKFEKQTFDAVFRRQTSDQIKERQEREGMNDLAFCRELVVGWKGIDDGGEEVPFSAEALEQVLQVPGAAAAMVQAAEHWARGGRADNTEALQDLEAFGGEVPAEWREALEQDEQDFEVEPEAWPVVMLWLRVQTQWRAGMAGAVGLDYPAVFAVMDRARIEDDDGELFAGVQVMELAALRALKD